MWRLEKSILGSQNIQYLIFPRKKRTLMFQETAHVWVALVWLPQKIKRFQAEQPHLSKEEVREVRACELVSDWLFVHVVQKYMENDNTTVKYTQNTSSWILSARWQSSSSNCRHSHGKRQQRGTGYFRESSQRVIIRDSRRVYNKGHCLFYQGNVFAFEGSAETCTWSHHYSRAKAYLLCRARFGLSCRNWNISFLGKVVLR